MGKYLMINNADFTSDSVETVKLVNDDWIELEVTVNENWWGNFIYGYLDPPSGDYSEYWTSNPINVEKYSYLYCSMISGTRKDEESVHLFYSDLPTTETASSLYLGKEVSVSWPPCTEESPVLIPRNAKYVVVMDYQFGSGVHLFVK